MTILSVKATQLLILRTIREHGGSAPMAAVLARLAAAGVEQRRAETQIAALRNLGRVVQIDADVRIPRCHAGEPDESLLVRS